MSDSSDSDCNVTPPKKLKIQNKRLQKYKSEWKTKYEWITKDPDEYKVKCVPCGISFSVAKSGIGQLKQHQETKQHKNKVEFSKKSSVLERFLQSPGSSHATNNENKIIAGELTLTYHTVKHNLSYNSSDCNVKLNKTIFEDSKVAKGTQLGRTKMEAIVNEVLGPYALKKVLTDLNHTNAFFSLQTDASNRKNVKLFPLVVQYFDVENGIQTKLLDFYENADESADGMFNAIKQSLSRNNISFERISGLSADNTNANFGVNHSLFKNIEKEVPQLIKGNCHAHIVHNTVKHAMKYLSCDIENVILKIYNHFCNSACRREELKRFVANVDGEWHELKRHIGTRWLSLLPAVDNILGNWEPITNYFIGLGDNCSEQIKNVLFMNEVNGNKKVQIYLHFTSHILNIFYKSIKHLECNDVTVIDLYSIMKTLKLDLDQRKKDNFFGYETNKILKTMETDFVSTHSQIKQNFALFIEKSLLYIEKWFNFSEDNWLYIIQNLNLKKDILFEHFESLIENLSLEKRLSINMDKLYSEITIAQEIYSNVKNCEEFKCKKSANQKWQYILKTSDSYQNLPNMLKIISFLLSIPATSAFSERIFSVMNVKWREERNKAGVVLIKNELLISINLNMDCNESYNIFLNDHNLLKEAKSAKKYNFKK